MHVLYCNFRSSKAVILDSTIRLRNLLPSSYSKFRTTIALSVPAALVLDMSIHGSDTYARATKQLPEQKCSVATGCSSCLLFVVAGVEFLLLLVELCCTVVPFSYRGQLHDSFPKVPCQGVLANKPAGA
mgnify:CR=1 FL=1